MYPLSNVLGNSLTDSYGEGYHYTEVTSYPHRVATLGCETEAEMPPIHHVNYGDISTDHYTTQSQTSEEFQLEHHSLNSDISGKFISQPVSNVWDCTTCGVGKMEEGRKCTTSGCEGCRRPIKRRNTANKKERRRTQSINNAFTELRDCIPNVPADTKLSKIKTLRLATCYIAHLSEILAGDDPLKTPASFTADLSRRFTRSSGSGCHEDKKKELGDSTSHRVSNSNSIRMDSRRGKGRTGWPQAVWAMELQQ